MFMEIKQCPQILITDTGFTEKEQRTLYNNDTGQSYENKDMQNHIMSAYLLT